VPRGKRLWKRVGGKCGYVVFESVKGKKHVEQIQYVNIKCLAVYIQKTEWSCKLDIGNNEQALDGCWNGILLRGAVPP
jgi:hypothetical protein